jgi:hypothetical protein
VDHAVVVHEPVGLTPGDLLLCVQVLLEELLVMGQVGAAVKVRGWGMERAGVRARGRDVVGVSCTST